MFIWKVRKLGVAAYACSPIFARLQWDGGLDSKTLELVLSHSSALSCPCKTAAENPSMAATPLNLDLQASRTVSSKIILLFTIPALLLYYEVQTG